MIYNLIQDTIDNRDIIGPKKPLFMWLPSSIDLREKCSPVVNQGPLASCSANAIVSGFREYLQYPSQERLSRLFLYWQERNMEGHISTDSGAMLRDGMRALTKIGVCSESEMPYDVNKFAETPSEKSIEEASQYKISQYHRVRKLDDLKYVLYNKTPVVFGMIIYESFETSTGNIEMPSKNEKCLGGHAMLAVGYNNKEKHIIVRNSWGEEWGDKGYCYIPYKVFDKYKMDMWTGIL